ncbi:MAG: LacI family DNA-binding transcriptional regulator [Aquiluna sp.]|nr:LacI family DNA-binding transcriptional regulator [Aquiluna sp.]
MPKTSQRQRQQRTTLNEVAQIAKVSKSTVSRVVNEDRSVADETRARVLAAIEATGYRVNQSARALVSNKTGAVAVAIYEHLATYFTSAFTGAMVTALQEYFFNKNLQVLILPAPDAKRQERIEKYIYDGHVDGAILLGPVHDDILLKDLLAASVPMVISGRPLSQQRVAFVDIDNVGASESVIDAMVAAGREQIGFISGKLSNPAASDRLLGYRRSIEKAGLESSETLIGVGDWGYESAIVATQQILSAHPDLDAIFCSNDLMATAAMAVLKDIGKQVPEDVAVVGFDNSPTALRTNPALTSVDQNPEEYAKALSEILLAQMSGEPRVESVILPTKIIWRESFAKKK